jgi:alkaline phosphatase D
MPIRLNAEDSLRLYREIQYGDLLNLYMCDTRLEGRDEQVGATSSEINDTNRRLLGEDQYNWLLNRLQNSTSQWNIIGQQVMMAPLEVFGLVLNPDQWDGYPAERNRFYGDILSNDINNLVVLTGDIHTSWANNLPGDNYNASTGSGSMGVEFVITSVTSVGFPFDLPTEIITAANPHVKWSNLNERGYLVLDVNKDRVQADWMLCESVFSSNTDVNRAKSYFVNDGETFLIETSTGSERDGLACAQAPIFDENLGIHDVIENNIIMLGVYPNPFEKEITIQYNSKGTEKVTLVVTTIEGLEISSFDFIPTKGLNYLNLDGQLLKKGTYIIKINGADRLLSKKIVRL